MTACEALLCLDAGGTFFKYTCFDRQGNRLFPPGQESVSSQGTAEEILAVYADIYRAASRLCRVRAVGIATPGPFRYSAGVSLMKHKFSALYGIDLKKAIQTAIGAKLPIGFLSDTNAFLLGAYSGTASCIGVTVGTGLGMAIMQDRQLLTDPSGAPLEVIYNKPCGDGKTVEDYVSARGICGMYGAGGGLTAKDIAQLARVGDGRAQECFTKLGTVLGGTLQGYVRQYGISRIILGGQVSKSADLFVPAMKKQLPGEVHILTAPAGEETALYGTFRHFADMLERDWP